MQRLGIQLKMAFAVAVRDSLSGRSLMGSQVQVSLPEDPGNRPVAKRDGYYVVLQGRVPVTRVQIHAPGYHPVECTVDPQLLKVTGQILYVWLVPDQTYPRAESGVLLHITGALPEERITVTETGPHRRIRILSQETGEKNLVRLFSPKQQELSGRSFAAMNGPAKTPGQEIRLLCREGEDAYLTEAALPPATEDAYLYPQQQLAADSGGCAWVVLKPDPHSGAVGCTVQNQRGMCLVSQKSQEKILRLCFGERASGEES